MDDIKKEIEDRFGRFPPFFKPAEGRPDVLSSLWGQVKALYLENPAPALFKEKLLARLSRYCPSSYCLITHSAALKSLGQSAADIWTLLRQPAPSLAEEKARGEVGLPDEWPAPGSRAEGLLLEAAEAAFLHPGGPAAARADLKKLAGPERFERLCALISFARTCHTWIDFHREVSAEDDPALMERAASLSDEEPMLADFFRNYVDMVQRDRQNLEDRLINEIERRRQMQEELTRYAAEMEESRDRMQEQATQMAKLAEELYKRREELLLEIGERKKVEESIRVYAEIVRNMPMGLNVWQMENPQDARSFRLIATNPSVRRFTGTDMEHAIGRAMSDIFPYLTEVPAVYADVIHTGRPREMGEAAYGEGGGPEGFFSIRVFPLPNHCVGVSYEDVTERKRAEEELSRARDAALELARVRSEFLANMSHEIRTPLNAIVGMTNLLLEAGITDEQRELALTVSHAGDALLGIVNDILDFSKIESGKMTLESVDFDLRTVVEGALELLQARAQAKGLGLSAMYDEGVPDALRGDPTRMRQVLINLVANAVKFTERGEVVVRTSLVSQKDGQFMIKIAVSDTGIGIAPEALRRLFQAFGQADASTTRKYGGTGLGLAISKRLVELMSGEIGVESEVGSGSTFWYRVPLEKARGGAAEGTVKDRLAGFKALILEPDAAARQVIQHFMLSWKMSVDAVASEPKALDLLRRAANTPHPYKLLSLGMSEGGEGLAFALKVKSDPSLAGLRVVAVLSSSKPLEGDVRRAAGIAAAVSKPVREGSLFNALADALAGVSRAKALARPEDAAAKKRYFRILLAEDNPVNQRVALLQLGRLGYSADVASSGREALKAMAENTYDLVFMDCQMPDMDGFAATEEIRRREHGERRTPIVAMTANALEGDRERCLTAGMDDYLSKPVDLRKMSDILLRWDVTLDPSVIEGLRELAGGETKLVHDVIDQFLKDAPKRLEAIRAAVGAGNADALEKAAHSLKGAGGNIGAKALWAVCEELEEMARKKDLEKAPAPLATLTEEFEKLKEELERERKR